ncbi:hypothetical protein QPK87_14060 [Kamptonema cortianum]|nr:hypothetical protein [Geitlerinema splendidum]MDK3157692.1 hypothetical protein [Kamptonema cortianum]
MKKILTPLLLLLLLTQIGIANTLAPEVQDGSPEIAMKIRKLEVLNQVVPILMTKEQIQKLLVPIEKARQLERDVVAREVAEMKKLELELDRAIQAGVKEKKLPTEELIAKITKMANAFTLARQVMVGTSVQGVYEVMKKELNEGQLKAAANALNASFFRDPKEASEMSEEDKIKLFIRVVLLDVAAYDVLVDLYRAS